MKQRLKGNLQNWKCTAATDCQPIKQLNGELAFFSIYLSLTVHTGCMHYENDYPEIVNLKSMEELQEEKMA